MAEIIGVDAIRSQEAVPRVQLRGGSQTPATAVQACKLNVDVPQRAVLTLEILLKVRLELLWQSRRRGP